MRQTLATTALTGLLTLVTITLSRADVVLSGPDSNVGSYSTSALAGLATSSDTASSAGLTGISLWGLLGGASASSPISPVYGGITTTTPAGDNNKNAILRYYLIATGASGATSVISLGEIDPSFGGTQPVPAFVAYQSGSGLLNSPELIVPGAPGRDLTGLTSLQLVAAPALPSSTGGASTSVVLSGAVGDAGNYTGPALAADFTPATETVSGDTYTGVNLFTFLDPSQSDIASQIVVVGATDGYEVVYAMGEFDTAAAFGGNPADLLPYADNGGNFPGDGVARTITPNDNAHGRWVSNVDAVTVFDVPEPASLTMLSGGLVLLFLLQYRKQALLFLKNKKPKNFCTLAPVQ